MWISGLRTRLVSVRMRVQSLASLSGLKDQAVLQLWHREQMRLRSGVAVAVGKAFLCLVHSRSILEIGLFLFRTVSSFYLSFRPPSLSLSFLFCLFRATPAAHGSAQVRGPVGATAARLHHSHSNMGSKLYL